MLTSTPSRTCLQQHWDITPSERQQRRVASNGLQTEVLVQVPLSQLAAVVSHAVQSDLQGSGTQLLGSVKHLTAEDACGQRRREAAESSSVSNTLSCFRVTSTELDQEKHKKFFSWTFF